ncbi:ABC transporter permease [Cyanobacterium sp. uoEpiScrs1]|uniref:ABC transporter permease n=1 Tax=Cyanobacterium sp. uoEpiScrs1 TaxID=2976343 RepID=UPI002269C310|nr:ABC transporter permease [Cyanobacterium sp. uoEpiScrs1]
MKTYLQVLRLFWATALTAELEYRFNFVIAIVSGFANLIGSLFSLSLFYGNGYTFQGWTWDEAMIVVGMFTFLQGISTTFLVPNLNRIVEQVERGTLDFVLLKPISSQFWLSCRIISPWGFSDLVFGIIIISYFSSKLSLHMGDYILSCITTMLGIIILYGIWFILGATSVWFVKIYNVTEVLRGLLEAGRYPISAYPAVYRFFFTFVVPVTFLTTVPAEVLLGKIEVLWILCAILVALSILLISHYFWQFALRFYTSASS